MKEDHCRCPGCGQCDAAEEVLRLRREIEALRDEMRHGPGFRTVTPEMAALEARLAGRLDAILAGGKS